MLQDLINYGITFFGMVNCYPGGAVAFYRDMYDILEAYHAMQTSK